MRILIPPSNSRSDCDADEADCAPSKGVKLNMVAVFSLRCRAIRVREAHRSRVLFMSFVKSMMDDGYSDKVTG
jgi:hypothetical protein